MIVIAMTVIAAVTVIAAMTVSFTRRRRGSRKPRTVSAGLKGGVEIVEPRKNIDAILLHDSQISLA
jgi:hypothetical protein